MKSFKFGEKRPEKPNDNVGPGHYSPERAELVTKPIAPSAKINPNSLSRPESFANKGQIGSLGPGEYASNGKFGNDAKTFKFGEKRPEKSNDNVGPGHYSPERAELVTKPIAPSAKINPNSPSRPSSYALSG